MKLTDALTEVIGLAPRCRNDDRLEALEGRESTPSGRRVPAISMNNQSGRGGGCFGFNEQ
jgi:hypothetical protein